jgi:hypothetical protein
MMSIAACGGAVAADDFLFGSHPFVRTLCEFELYFALKSLLFYIKFT